MAFKDTAKTYANKLKLGPHHAIERFGVLFGVVTITGALLATSVTGSAVVNNRAALDSTALYTSSFSASKTGLSGTVAGVYVSEDRTRTMLMMRFDDGAAGSFSANAENYQAFATGSTRDLSTQALETNIDGDIVMFGSTGYMGVVLDSDAPFEQQIINLTVRANSELAYVDGDSRELREDMVGDSTFSEFDQWRLYFNPGSSGAEELSALNSERIDAGAIYSEMVISSQEDEVREQMEGQLVEMQTTLARIQEYNGELERAKVDGVGIEPPELPVQISSDGSMSGLDQIVGERANEGQPSTLELDTDWVSPKGYDFDWRAGSVEEGYLDALVPEDESYVTYLANKGNAEDTSEATGGALNEQRFQPNNIEWMLTDGTNLKSDYGDSDTTMKPLRDIMNNLTQAYQDYYRQKIDFQEGSYSELLELEVQLRNVESSHSINDTEDALLTY